MNIKDFLKQTLSLRQKSRIHIFISKLKLVFLKKQIGKETFIDKTVHITGWASVSIGESSAISEYSWLNVNARIRNHKHIVIGNNCYIGRRNFFSSGKQIIISDYCMTGIDCKLIGSDHIFDNPMKPYISTGTTNNKSIQLGVNVRLGANVNVIGNVTIGHGSIIGAGSMVTKDIPPFSIAVGSPCIVIKRFDFEVGEWIDSSKFNYENIKLMPDEERYIKDIEEQNIDIYIPKQACSKLAGDLF